MKCAGTFSRLSSLRKWKMLASRTGASRQAIHDAVHLRKPAVVSVRGEAGPTNISANTPVRIISQRFRMSLTVSDYSPKVSRNSCAGTEDTKKSRNSSGLGEVGDFFVEVGQGGFQGFAVIGMSGGAEIVGDAGSRELQLLDTLFADLLFFGF